MVKPIRIDLYRFQGSHTKKRTLEVRTYDKQKQNDCLEHKVLSFWQNINSRREYQAGPLRGGKG